MLWPQLAKQVHQLQKQPQKYCAAQVQVALFAKLPHRRFHSAHHKSARSKISA